MIYNVWFTTYSAIPVPNNRKCYAYRSDDEYHFGEYVMVDTAHGPALCIIANRITAAELEIPPNRLKQIFGRVMMEPYLERKLSRARRTPPVWWDEMTGGRGLTWWRENSSFQENQEAKQDLE